MDQSRRNIFILNLICIVLGAIVFLFPSGLITTMFRLVGIALFVFGIYGIVSYYKKDPAGRFTGRMPYVFAALIVGFLFMTAPVFIVSIFPLIMGILILVAGISNLMKYLRMRKAGFDNWSTGLILSVFVIILGAVILGNPFSTAVLLLRVTGIALVYKGAAGIFSDKKDDPDIVDEQ